MLTKHNLFWYFIIPILIFITVFISILPWLLELIATPGDRIFSGINRWSTDYYIYLSYVELGKRGILPVKLLNTTLPHPSLWAHLVYTIPGFLLGHILNFNAIFIYHFSRVIYGIFFLLAAIWFFYKLSKSRLITVTAFFLAFFVSGFAKIKSLIPFDASRYLAWLQEQNIIGRATGPLHYNAGFVMFIVSVLYYFYNRSVWWKKSIIFGFFLNLTILANPFAFLLLTLSFGLYFLVKIISNLKNMLVLKNEFVILTLSYLLVIPLFLYFNYFLSLKPWGIVGLSPKYYIVTTPPISLTEAIMSIGPIFFLGIMGIILTILKREVLQSKKHGIKPLNILIFLISWLIIQFFLLLFGDKVKIHPPRAFSGLYYLPLAFFSSVFIVSLAKKITKTVRINYLWPVFLTLAILFIITLPNYYLSFKEHLYAFTDFRSFQQLSYPTKKQVEAFAFLEKHTPAGSGVLAMFEASSLIIGFSANATELDMPHNIKVGFYSNQMADNEAIKFLKDNRFQYVYYGYQEKSAGGSMEKYPFLKKIYENKEVTIYKVH
ncbi:MAG: hypothetical protein US11_C0005G0007 [Candidatus Roizmanbacteria bacterium GW2011_GWA2_36_23]|uniref:Glycosyltransferase RgtA/B/C/D-like domain-containing protein n=1 Tax=Candidatus Roizmanbacteria bacterium GW2011_GWA2_36_23 TaxID=1618480 RepID=A0A0G0HCM7_9BACT|nr:MAG: hypothetical protein US11_C0005G0007 [Candidatus Roizmanbacteria bacterium GW2011_GWA2_36_23]